MPKGWARIRLRILRRDGWRCYLCSRPANQVDHVVPHAAGGSDTDSNLKAICEPCHLAKSAREGREGLDRAKGRRNRHEEK